MASNHQNPCVPSRYWLKVSYTKIHVAVSQGRNTNHLKRTATHDSLSTLAVITCNRGSGAPDARATIHVRHLTSGPMGSTLLTAVIQAILRGTKLSGVGNKIPYPIAV